jgi:periplasmic protein TonB
MIANPRRASSVLLALLLLCGLAIGDSQVQSTPPPPTQAKQDAPLGVPDSTGVNTGLLIKKVNPKYPKKARKQKIEGVVVLKAKITQDGDIVDLSVVSGDPLLVQAAVDAVKQWKYRPYLRDGQPVEVDTEITVNFRLSGH